MAILAGSFLGFLSAIFGMTFWDLTFFEAFTLYLMSGIGAGFLSIGFTVINCLFANKQPLQPT